MVRLQPHGTRHRRATGKNVMGQRGRFYRCIFILFTTFAALQHQEMQQHYIIKALLTLCFWLFET